MRHDEYLVGGDRKEPQPPHNLVAVFYYQNSNLTNRPRPRPRPRPETQREPSGNGVQGRVDHWRRFNKKNVLHSGECPRLSTTTIYEQNRLTELRTRIRSAVDFWDLLGSPPVPPRLPAVDLPPKAT